MGDRHGSCKGFLAPSTLIELSQHGGMSTNLTATDVKVLTRIASKLPVGNARRVAILHSLRRAFRNPTWLRSVAKDCVFHFRTQALADLWEHELLGQISDGKWENTSGTGWEFWANIPIQVGGSTQITGSVPSASVRRNFNFAAKDLIDIVGDDWLSTVQKTEPTATMGTVLRYIKEIKDAMSGVPSTAPGQTPSVKGAIALPDEKAQRHDHTLMMRAAFDAAGISPVNPRAVQCEAFMYAPSGGRAGQYRYFCVIANGYSFSACSAYGKFGKIPKGVHLGTTNMMDAKDLIRGKAKAKLTSGYEITDLFGVRLLLNVLTGQVTNAKTASARTMEIRPRVEELVRKLQVVDPHAKGVIFDSGYLGAMITYRGIEYILIDQPGVVGLEDQSPAYIELKRKGVVRPLYRLVHRDRSFGDVGLNQQELYEAYRAVYRLINDRV